MASWLEMEAMVLIITPKNDFLGFSFDDTWYTYKISLLSHHFFPFTGWTEFYFVWKHRMRLPLE